MFENLVALNVIDEQMYNTYREKMIPILIEYGGGFNYDFKISDVLINKGNNPINRVFTIFFPNEETATRFFTNPEYIKIKKQYFEKAVNSTTIISSYNKS